MNKFFKHKSKFFFLKHGTVVIINNNNNNNKTQTTDLKTIKQHVCLTIFHITFFYILLDNNFVFV